MKTYHEFRPENVLLHQVKVIRGLIPVGTALISSSLPSTRHCLKLQDHGQWTRATVSVYLTAFTGTNLYCLVTEEHGCEQLA